ncbi:hypothetical protein GJ496_006276 [Pomphorhynchus laevis]|nr:hypothetical protein GJ496_006276 [Pomphorhynchus laevis]
MHNRRMNNNSSCLDKSGNSKRFEDSNHPRRISQSSLGRPVSSFRSFDIPKESLKDYWDQLQFHFHTQRIVEDTKKKELFMLWIDTAVEQLNKQNKLYTCWQQDTSSTNAKMNDTLPYSMWVVRSRKRQDCKFF